MSAASEGRCSPASRAGRLFAPVAGLLVLACLVSCAGPASYAKRTAGAKDFVPHDSDPTSSRVLPVTAAADAHVEEARPSRVEGTATEAGTMHAEDERAIAVGLLLDSAPSAQAIDEGLAIAAVLRRCYGLEGDDSVRGREELARRARRDILDRLDPSEAEIRHAAAALGYSLEPEQCSNTCENVRNLALLELEKQALRALAKAPPGSCAERAAAARDPIPAH